MRILYSLFFNLMLFSTLLSAQRKTYVAKDGTEVDVEIMNIHPDEGRNASIFLGPFGPEGINFIGGNFHNPGKYYLNGLLGQSGGQLDGSFFLISKIKDSKISQSVKSTGTYSSSTRYVVKVPIKKRISFGLHGGASYVDYSKIQSDYYEHNAIGIFGGFSYLKSKHTHWKIFDDYKEAQGTLVKRLNADFIYYFVNQPHNTSLDPSDVPLATRKIGARIYYDGKATFWSKHGRIGFNYMLGVGLNSGVENLPIFAGIGLGYSFL